MKKIFFLVACAAQTYAGDFSEANAACMRGDYETAFRLYLDAGLVNYPSYSDDFATLSMAAEAVLSEARDDHYFSQGWRLMKRALDHEQKPDGTKCRSIAQTFKKVPNSVIVMLHEKGIGDTVHFMPAYAKAIKEKLGYDVVAQVNFPRLKDLLVGCSGITEVVTEKEREDTLEKYRKLNREIVYVYAFDLPRYFSSNGHGPTKMGSIPCPDCQLIFPQEKAVTRVQSFLAQNAQHAHHIVPICWGAGPETPLARPEVANRDVPVGLLVEKLVEQFGDDVCIVSIQGGRKLVTQEEYDEARAGGEASVYESDIIDAVLRNRVIQLTDDEYAFSGAVALVNSGDQRISPVTVDTSTLHVLARAMPQGMQAYLLLQQLTDWRNNNPKARWYAEDRVVQLRQQEKGDWNQPIDELIKRLTIKS